MGLTFIRLMFQYLHVNELSKFDVPYSYISKSQVVVGHKSSPTKKNGQNG